MLDRTPITLSSSIQFVKGVGEKRAAEFLKLGVQTCRDLLFFFPRDYLHFTDEAPVAAARPGEIATVRGTILQTRMIPRRPRRFEALLEDASGTDGGRCVLTWFNPYGLAQKILPGTQLRATGKVTVFRNRNQMVQPKVEVLDEDAESLEKKKARIEPVYPATADLPSPAIWRVTKGILEELTAQVDEWFIPDFLAERHLFTRRDALLQIHQPRTLKDSITAQRTLAYHEFFLHQAAFAIKRHHQRHGNPAAPLRVDDAVDRRIRALLPFSFTAAQARVIDAIRKDLAGTRPMNRLLQGDVGSGKTVVALYAMLAACATPRSQDSSLKTQVSRLKTPTLSPQHFTGHQAALMAPTEILAEQHFITLSELLAGKKVKIALLTGSVTGREREQVLADIANGHIGIVVGTHALLSESVRFKSLAVVVIDEQHKFGVEQRSLIRTRPTESGIAPHTLVMTATPIPRTLAMTAFGDLDVSVIDELPPGRQPIFTKMTANREDVYEWLAKRLKAGEQAYIVAPAIDADAPMEEELELADDPDEGTRSVSKGEGRSTTEPRSFAQAMNNPSTKSDPSIENQKWAGAKNKNLTAAVSLHGELERGLLKNFRIGLIHGRMARDTRQHIMERFRQGIIDVLVATTVIEVGVDVPNATTMIVENADRFGLSQLHQLRGRVGRGSKQSWCVLVGDMSTDAAVARLQAMIKHSSGFDIAEADLKLRGMGKLIGTAQSGRSDFHFADLLFDPHLLPMSRRDAFNLIAADPRLLDPAHAAMRTAILDRFADTITLADVG